MNNKTTENDDAIESQNNLYENDEDRVIEIYRLAFITKLLRQRHLMLR